MEKQIFLTPRNVKFIISNNITRQAKQQEHTTKNEEKNQSIKTDREQTQMLKQQKMILEQFVTVFHMFKKKSSYVKNIKRPK